MIKNYKNTFKLMMIFLLIEAFLCGTPILLCASLYKEPSASYVSTSVPVNKKVISFPYEKRGYPTYDTIMGSDGWPHYRVFFWVPKTASKYTPYADEGINTDVSSHGPAEKWSVVETKAVNGDEKLVFIFVPKTFVYLYGKGFEKVIHLRYS